MKYFFHFGNKSKLINFPLLILIERLNPFLSGIESKEKIVILIVGLLSLQVCLIVRLIEAKIVTRLFHKNNLIVIFENDLIVLF